MGPSETAITIPGALEKLTFLTGTGRHRVQITYFFRMQIGSRTPSGIGLGSGGHRHRKRLFLGLSRELWIQNFGDLYQRSAHFFFFSFFFLSFRPYRRKQPPLSGREKSFGQVHPPSVSRRRKRPDATGRSYQVMPPTARHCRTHYAAGLPSGSSGHRAADS